VHLTFLNKTTYDILYVKYTYSTNSFGTETTLQAGATSTSAPVLSIDPSTNDLYVFAATKTTGTPSGWTANHIYYIKYTASSGTWGSWTDWIDETTEVLFNAGWLTCFYKAYDSKIGLVYLTKTASPWNVKFAFLPTQKLNLCIKDTNGNTINGATALVSQISGLSDSDGWVNFTLIQNSTVSVSVKYQDVWVNGTFTVTMDSDKTIDVVCNVYSLTVKVQTASGAPISDCPLELWRDSTLLNGLYGLPSSPKTDSNGMFTWQQLANQSSSYIIKTPWAGIPWTTTPLTQDTLIIITQAAPAPAPSPTPTPTPTPAPTITPTPTIPTWLIILIIAIATVIGYAVVKRATR
jgi:hypothetical protein